MIGINAWKILLISDCRKEESLELERSVHSHKGKALILEGGVQDRKGKTLMLHATAH